MFAVLFFLMLFVLGIGSTVGMGSCILRVIRDQFGKRAGPSWALASALVALGFGVSIVYVTPGGQFIVNLIDFYGVSFTALILAIGELLAVAWFYGTFVLTVLALAYPFTLLYLQLPLHPLLLH